MKSRVRVLERSGATALAARGLFWLLAQVAGGRATSFVSQIILARLLSPQDFGTIGLTYTVTTVIGTLTASGIENVLLQRSRTLQLWAWPGFWINMVLAALGAALIFALAPFFASLYGAPEIEGLASVVAFGMPFSALSMIPMVAIRAALNFRLLALIGTAELIATQLLTILLAWYGMGALQLRYPIPSHGSRQGSVAVGNRAALHASGATTPCLVVSR
jgi:teichuronic acid exporter